MALDWSDIGKVALTSSVVAAGVTAGVNRIRDFFVQRASARFLAQRLAVILERFAIDCADVIVGNEMYREHAGHAGLRRLRIPALAEFPADADWKAIEPALAGRAVALPNEIVLGEQKISFYEDVLRDPECLETETNQQAGKCGYRAWNLATELRRHHHLPVANLTELSWDFVVPLREQHGAAIKSRQDETTNGEQVEAKNREREQLS